MAWIYPFTRGPTRVRGGHTTWWHLIKWWHYWWTIISHTVLTTAVLGSVVVTAKAVVNQVDYKLGQLVTSLLGNRDCQDIEIDQLDPSDQPDHSNQSDQPDEYSDDFTDSDYEIELERVQESSDEINEIIYQRDISANTVPKKIFMIGSSRVERLTRSYSAPQLSLVETNQGNQDNKVTTPLDSNLIRSFSSSLISLSA